MKKFRTHNCSQLRENEIDKNVILSGWLHRKKRSWKFSIY